MVKYLCSTAGQATNTSLGTCLYQLSLYFLNLKFEGQGQSGSQSVKISYSKGDTCLLINLLHAVSLLADIFCTSHECIFMFT